MNTKSFFLRTQSHLCFAILGTVILASCAPAATPTVSTTTKPTVPPTESTEDLVEVHITAKYLGSDTEIVCPPICMQSEVAGSHSDAMTPLSFKVCSTATQECVQVESGATAQVPADAIIRAPDGVSPGEQLPRLEDDSGPHFHSWDDGATTNPRPVVSSKETLELTAFYTAGEPDQITTTAEEAGCDFSEISPNWVQVQPEPEYVEIQGPVVASHVATTDWPLSHNTKDFTFWVLLNDSYFHLLSQNRSGQRGERPDQIQVEWETGSYPTWAWPNTEAPSTSDLDRPGEPPEVNDADFVWVRGKHIYDCGHQSDDIVQGAWTEIHPAIATAVMKGTLQGKSFPRQFYDIPELNEKANGLEGVEIDVWINGDGGPAVKHVKCGEAISIDPLDPQGCVYDPVFAIQGVYEFDVPLPPPPADLDSQANFLVAFSHLLSGQPEPEVTQTTAGLHVRIDLSDYNDSWRTCDEQNNLFDQGMVNCNGNAYGVQIIAGWETFTYPPDLHQIRLTLHGLKIYDDYEGEDGDGEFELYLEVGPSAALVSSTDNHLKLHRLNKELNDVEGNGETYELRTTDGEYLTYIFYISDDALKTERNKLYFSLSGMETDPFFNDALNKLQRVFYLGNTIWDPKDGWPDWADQNYYGQETEFGTVRTNTPPPIPYDDHVWGNCADFEIEEVCFVYSLEYEIEELPLE